MGELYGCIRLHHLISNPEWVSGRQAYDLGFDRVPSYPGEEAFFHLPHSITCSITSPLVSHLLKIQCVFEPVYMYYVGACCRVGRIDTPTPLRLHRPL